MIEGPQAGGHLGFKKEELSEYTPETYGEEIQRIIRTVKKIRREVRRRDSCCSCRRYL